MLPAILDPAFAGKLPLKKESVIARCRIQGRQPLALILLRAPRAQRACALEVGLENDIASLRLRETRERNHHEAAGETDSLLTLADKLVGTGHAAE